MPESSVKIVTVEDMQPVPFVVPVVLVEESAPDIEPQPPAESTADKDASADESDSVELPSEPQGQLQPPVSAVTAAVESQSRDIAIEIESGDSTELPSTAVSDADMNAAEPELEPKPESHDGQESDYSDAKDSTKAAGDQEPSPPSGEAGEADGSAVESATQGDTSGYADEFEESSADDAEGSGEVDAADKQHAGEVSAAGAPAPSTGAETAAESADDDLAVDGGAEESSETEQLHGGEETHAHDQPANGTETASHDHPSQLTVQVVDSETDAGSVRVDNIPEDQPATSTTPSSASVNPVAEDDIAEDAHTAQAAEALQGNSGGPEASSAPQDTLQTPDSSVVVADSLEVQPDDIAENAHTAQAAEALQSNSGGSDASHASYSTADAGQVLHDSSLKSASDPDIHITHEAAPSSPPMSPTSAALRSSMKGSGTRGKRAVVWRPIVAENLGPYP